MSCVFEAHIGTAEGGSVNQAMKGQGRTWMLMEVVRLVVREAIR